MTQGTGEPPTLNGQPAMTYGAAMVTVGWPLTSTRGFGAVGVAVPPWAQSTEAPTMEEWSGHGQITVKAPLLIVTVGPISVMTAPLPFWM